MSPLKIECFLNNRLLSHVETEDGIFAFLNTPVGTVCAISRLQSIKWVDYQPLACRFGTRFPSDSRFYFSKFDDGLRYHPGLLEIRDNAGTLVRTEVYPTAEGVVKIKASAFE